MLTMMISPPLTEANFDEHLAQLEATWKARTKQLADHEAVLKRKSDRLDVFEKSLTEWEWHLKDTLDKQVDAHCQFLSQQREDHQKFSRLLQVWGNQLTEIENEMKISVKDQIAKHFEFLSAARMRAPADPGAM